MPNTKLEAKKMNQQILSIWSTNRSCSVFTGNWLSIVVFKTSIHLSYDSLRKRRMMTDQVDELNFLWRDREVQCMSE
jgi:hypothetical protein